jgi:hypothetical protein
MTTFRDVLCEAMTQKPAEIMLVMRDWKSRSVLNKKGWNSYVDEDHISTGGDFYASLWTRGDADVETGLQDTFGRQEIYELVDGFLASEPKPGQSMRKKGFVFTAGKNNDILSVTKETSTPRRRT